MKALATRSAGRTGVGLVLAATTIAAMTVPAGATTLPPAPQHQTLGATALALAPAPTLTPRALSQRPAPMSTYRVRAGDTVSHIALRTGTSVSAIITANNLNSRALIKAGQTLRIPGEVARTSAPSRSTAPRAASTTHTVVAGDTVSALATRYSTTVSAIASANNLNSRALILVGQRLTIPGGSSSSSSSSSGSSSSSSSSSGSSANAASGTHVVRAGETVSALATRYGTSVSGIVSANGLRNAGLIYVGQQLTIPGAGSGGAASTGGSTSTGQQLVGDTFLGRTYARDVVSAANTNKATLNSMNVPSRDQMRAMVRQTALSMGVDPALALAVAQQESGFDQRAVSPANAVGTMQVIPSSGDWAAGLVGRPLNLLDPQDNVTAGVAILRQLLRSADSFDQAVAGYYQGLAGVRRNGMYADTRNYVAGIKNLMRQY